MHTHTHSKSLTAFYELGKFFRLLSYFLCSKRFYVFSYLRTYRMKIYFFKLIPFIYFHWSLLHEIKLLEVVIYLSFLLPKPPTFLREGVFLIFIHCNILTTPRVRDDEKMKILEIEKRRKIMQSPSGAGSCMNFFSSLIC